MQGAHRLLVASRGGTVGLSNLGNTCFMNAGLQCLSHLEPLSLYFLSGKYAEAVRRGRGPAGAAHGELARSFAKLQEELWQRSSGAYPPRPLHTTLSRFAPHLFEDMRQQDVQEFLAFLLDGLHEDLNLVRTPPRAASSRARPRSGSRGPAEGGGAAGAASKGREARAADLAWTRHLRRHRSFLVDLFQGQLRSRLACCRCKKESDSFEPCLMISVPLAEGMRSLEDALSLYVAEETLSGQEQWRCPRCQRRVNARKKIDIWKLPPVLILHLKRFAFDPARKGLRKIEVELKSPLTVDLSRFARDPEGRSHLYSIVGVANHSGNCGSGHYTATCKHPITGSFHVFNDDHVEELRDVENVLTKDAYVLFLARDAQELHAHLQSAAAGPRAPGPRPGSTPPAPAPGRPADLE
ncbi:unnamed protein product, partial [Prorocentrum cordatum]